MGIEQDVKDADALARTAWVVAVCTQLGQDEFWTLRIWSEWDRRAYGRVYTSVETATKAVIEHPNYDARYDSIEWNLVHWKLANFIEVDQ